MSTRTKSILLFVGGMVTGIVITIAFLVCLGWYKTHDESNNDDVVMFEKPQQEIKAKTFRVMQVLPDGSALATVDDGIDSPNFGMVVALPGGNGMSYYDDQRIEVPSGKRVMQVGTYKYMTRQNVEKTVPIVQAMD